MKSGIHLTTKAGKYQNTYLVCAKENEPTFASTERYGMCSRWQMSLRSEVRSPLVSRGGDRDSRHADPDVLNLRLPPPPGFPPPAAAAPLVAFTLPEGGLVALGG